MHIQNKNAQVNQYLYDDIKSPCATRLLGNKNTNTDIDMGDDNGEGNDRAVYNWEGYNSEDYAGKDGG